MKPSDISFLETAEGIEDYIDEARSRGVTERGVKNHSSDYVPYVEAEMVGDNVKMSIFNLFYSPHWKGDKHNEGWKFAHELNGLSREIFPSGFNGRPFDTDEMSKFKNGDVVITHTVDESGLLDQEYFYVCFMIRANGKDNPVFACIKASEPKEGYVEYLTIRKDKLRMAVQQKTFQDAMLYIYGFPSMDNVVTDQRSSDTDVFSYRRYDEFAYYAISDENRNTYGKHFSTDFPTTNEEKFLYWPEIQVFKDAKEPGEDDIAWGKESFIKDIGRTNYSLSIIEDLIRSDFMFWVETKHKKVEGLVKENWDVYQNMRDVAREIIGAQNVPLGFDKYVNTFSDWAPLKAFIFGPAFSMVRYAIDLKKYQSNLENEEPVWRLFKNTLGYFNTKKFRKILSSPEYMVYAVNQYGANYDILTGRVKYPVKQKDDFRFHVGDEVRRNPDYTPAAWEEVAVKPFKRGTVKAARKKIKKSGGFEYNVYDIQVSGTNVIGNVSSAYSEIVTIHEDALELFVKDYSSADIISQDAALRRTILAILNPIMEDYLKERWDHFRHLFSASFGDTTFIGDREQATEMAYNRASLNFGVFNVPNSEEDADYKKSSLEAQNGQSSRISKLWFIRDQSKLPHGSLLFYDRAIDTNPMIHKQPITDYSSVRIWDAHYRGSFLNRMFSLVKDGEMDWLNELEVAIGDPYIELSLKIFKDYEITRKGLGTLTQDRIDYNAIYEWLRYELPVNKTLTGLMASCVFTPFMEKKLRRQTARFVESNIITLRDKISYRKEKLRLMVKPGSETTLEIVEILNETSDVEWVDQKGIKTKQKLEPGTEVEKALFSYVREEIPEESEALHKFLQKIASQTV